MYKKYQGIITYIKIIKDNDLYIRLLTSNDNLVSGIVYGGNSSKKKFIYQLGNFVNFNFLLKNNNAIPTINAEITPPFIGSFIEDKYKAFSLLAIISLLNLSIIEGQKNNGLFISIKNLINIINSEKHWIVDYCQWLIYLLKIIGYEIEYKKKSNYKYFNLNTHEFIHKKINQQVVMFPHDILTVNEVSSMKGIKSVFTIFENIFKKNHLNKDNAKMPIHYINFKEIIFQKLET